MPRKFSLLGICLLLCQCAVKHPTTQYDPYYPSRPSSYFSVEQAAELRDLESRELVPLEKKRRWELLRNEKQNLPAASGRRKEIETELNRLTPELSSLDHELREVQLKNDSFRENKEPETKSVRWTTPNLRKRYLEIYNLWNRDQSEAALRRANELLANGELAEKMQSDERFKLHGLRCRIALELGDVSTAEASFASMREEDRCAQETAQAGFLLALHTFAQGNAPLADAKLQQVCDKDESVANRLKYSYWRARFKDSGSPDSKLYAPLLKTALPGYYGYLASLRSGVTLTLPIPKEEKGYLSQVLKLSPTLESLIQRGEERLRYRLRRDAAVFFTRASQMLREKPNPKEVPQLLYTAHLLHAAGTHLEAMKIYSTVMSLFLEHEIDSVSPREFVSEMFPRPFLAEVEWLSRLWGQDPDFIYALMRQESAFNPGALSSADARGLMQLMPLTGKSLALRWRQTNYSERWLFVAQENLKLATFHLSQLQGAVPHMALMAGSYNAGLTRASGWWKKFGHLPLDLFVELIPVSETRNYIKLVVRNFLYYRGQRSGGVIPTEVVPLTLPIRTVTGPHTVSRHLD